MNKMLTGLLIGTAVGATAAFVATPYVKPARIKSWVNGNIRKAKHAANCLTELQ